MSAQFLPDRRHLPPHGPLVGRREILATRYGPLKGLTYGNGLALTRTYNLNAWLTRIQVKATGSTALDLGYQYYDDGRLGEIDDNAATGRTVLMSLTNAGRLNYTKGPWGEEAYSYDAAGNRTGRYLTVGTVSTTDNEITAGNSNRLVQTQDQKAAVKRNLTYRAGGDLAVDAQTGGAAYRYFYNARKRLNHITVNNQSAATYGYDFREQRVWRTVKTTTIHYIFDENGYLLAEHNGATGAVIREYVWIDDMPVAVIDSSSGRAKTYYIHTGRLEEPLVMTDAAKAKVWDGYITPFGSAKVFTPAKASMDMRLPGQWFQAEAAGAGLNQNHHRDYDPSLGRYIEADPLGIDAGPNPYSYVNGEVYDAVDPTGECGPFCGAAIGALFGAGLEVANQTRVQGRDFQHLDGGAIAREAIIGAVAGGTGAGIGALAEKGAALVATRVAVSVTGAVVKGAFTSGVSSALHCDKLGTFAVKVTAGAAFGGFGKAIGNAVTRAVGAAPKAVPGQLVTWGASKVQTPASKVAGTATSLAIGSGGKAASVEGCKRAGSCQ